MPPPPPALQFAHQATPPPPRGALELEWMPSHGPPPAGYIVHPYSRKLIKDPRLTISAAAAVAAANAASAHAVKA
eukprot:6931155-Prymnesium_polylepis.1